MNTWTIFQAYTKAIDTKEICISARNKGNQGIAVDSDPWAVFYQVADRQADKLFNRLQQRLDPDHAPVTCWLCGKPMVIKPDRSGYMCDHYKRLRIGGLKQAEQQP